MLITLSKFQFYIIKRLVYALGGLFAISIITFSMTQGLPGTAADIRLGVHATDTSVELLEEQLRLGDPIYIQYIDWAIGFVTLDWGTSYISGEPILPAVVDRLIRSFQLAVMSFLVIATLGIVFGVLSAVYNETWIDELITKTAYVGVSIPSFVAGVLLLFIFAGPNLQWFPSGGYVPLREDPLGWLHRMILPTVTVSIIATTHTLRQTRQGMLEALRSDYIRTAHLKGLDKWTVISKHALRNGLLSTVTILAMSFGWLMGSLVIVEEIFNYPGLGVLLVDSIQNRDIPVVQAIIMIIAAAYLLSNLVADIVYTYLDPRIEYE